MKCSSCGYEESGKFQFCPTCGMEQAAMLQPPPLPPQVNDHIRSYVDPAKIKGIYLMTCSPGAWNKDKHSELASYALRDLKKKNISFQKLHFKALSDKPPLYEGFQSIPVGLALVGLALNVIISNFIKWLQEKGVIIDQKRWDQYLFNKEVTETTTIGVLTHYVLVYYHT